MGTHIPVAPYRKENDHMSAIDTTIKKIIDQLETLDENQLLYVYTFIKKLFGNV